MPQPSQLTKADAFAPVYVITKTGDKIKIILKLVVMSDLMKTTHILIKHLKDYYSYHDPRPHPTISTRNMILYVFSS